MKLYPNTLTMTLMYNVFDCSCYLVCSVLAVMVKTEKQQHYFSNGPALQLQSHKTASHGMKVCVVGPYCLVCEFVCVLCLNS